MFAFIRWKSIEVSGQTNTGEEPLCEGSASTVSRQGCQSGKEALSDPSPALATASSVCTLQAVPAVVCTSIYLSHKAKQDIFNLRSFHQKIGRLAL